jgi:polyisoprenoid-binding protein YceI
LRSKARCSCSVKLRPMRLEVSRFKCGLNLALRKRGCGADAQGVLRRSEFGLQNGLPFIGDDVRLRIQVEAYPAVIQEARSTLKLGARGWFLRK